MNWLISILLLFLPYSFALLPQAVALEYHQPIHQINFALSQKCFENNLSVALQQYQISNRLSTKDQKFYANKELQAYMFAMIANLSLLNNGNKLDYKCAKTLSKFYQTGERKTLELISKLHTNLPPPPLHTVALTPEGFEIGIASQAAAIATGNQQSVLAKIEQFGSGNSLFASTAKSLRGGNSETDRSQPNGRYEDASYHSKLGNSQKSKRPVDGQKALDNSVLIEEGKRRRIGISENEIVILDQTSKGQYHGHVRTWDQLRQEMKNTLVENGLANRKGKLIKKTK